MKIYSSAIQLLEYKAYMNKVVYHEEIVGYSGH